MGQREQSESFTNLKFNIIMRNRIPYISLSQKVADKKRELAVIIAKESNCSMTRAYKQINFNLELARI